MKRARGLWLALAPAIALAQPGAPPADRDLEKRLPAILRRMEGLSPGTPKAREVGAELESLGRSYLERGDTGRAIELLEQSYGLDPTNGLALAELTLAYVRAGNFPFARFYLELAQEQAPRSPPEAYAVLGDVYHSLNRLDDAVFAWEQFERLGGTHPGILRRLRSAREELSVSSGQVSREIGDFVFFFDAGIPAGTAEAAAEPLTAKSRELSSFFQEDLPPGQVVILYAGRAYFALVSIPDWISGVFDGKIRLAIDPAGGLTPELEMVLSHELAHAFVRHASKDRAPGWLHEGLAQWFEGKRLSRAELKEAFLRRPVVSVHDLEGNLARKTDRAAARSNYVQALGLIEYLMAERGPAAMACLVRELGDGARLEEALRRETGWTAEELVGGFRSWTGLDAPAAARHPAKPR